MSKGQVVGKKAQRCQEGVRYEMRQDDKTGAQSWRERQGDWSVWILF